MSFNINSVTGASSAEFSAHTEQAAVELVYVREANSLLGDAMGNLASALNVTQSVLNILQALQNLHNSLSVNVPSTFPFDFKTGYSLLSGVGIHWPFPFPPPGSLNRDNYISSYLAVASAYFGKPILPFFTFRNASDPGFAIFANRLLAIKNSLQREIRILSALTPAADRGAGSLYDSLKNVYNSLPTHPLNFTETAKWAIDNLDAAVGQVGGDIQNDLTTAITAAQSLNDSQKERVRRFLFIFQEYYQSASAILSKITQIIEQMAQKISS